MIRLKNLREVWELYNIDPDDNQSSAGENAQELLDLIAEKGESILGRFLVITCAGEWTYGSKTAETFEEAKNRSYADADNPTWAESPLAIHDLDTGVKMVPKWSSMLWEESALEG